MTTRDIDTIIATLRQHPGLEVQQISVKFAGIDDDGVWNFRHPAVTQAVSLESSTGMLPFVVESTGHDLRQEVGTVAEAVSLVEAWLGLRLAG